MVVCYHCGGKVTTNFGEWTWCQCWVPLHGAIVVCYGGGRGSGAIAGCNCSVLWWGEGRVTANFGGADVVPLQGAIVFCYGLGGG